jgi:phospholipid/cholesterol/gamma-HCH transport system substrate-binding protein
MKFSIRFADQIVGALVILALAILIVVIFMLGINQRWFIRDPQYKTYFRSVSGLSRNMAVQYMGFTIGNVKNFTLVTDEGTKEDRVEVIFSIYKEHSDRVLEGSVVELRSSPIGLGNSFIFYPGRGPQPHDPEIEIPEINSGEAAALRAKGLTNLPETNDSINNIISNIEGITNNISRITEELNLAEISENIRVLTEDISKKLEPILSDFGTIAEQAASPQGTVMSVLDSEGPMYTELIALITSLAGTIENIEKTSEFVPSQLPQVAVLLSDLSVALRNMQDVLTAVANNPLLRGGIPQRVETSPGGTNPRNLDF